MELFAKIVKKLKAVNYFFKNSEYASALVSKDKDVSFLNQFKCQR